MQHDKLKPKTASLILLQRYEKLLRKTNFLSIICTENTNFFHDCKILKNKGF
uniref:Uncharacterized protein n=1 Tax=Myoviridae sp. ctFYw8 TaxID=2825069 RepID=A0A8S5PEN2_9CAUD|nr:MAG TPA: hypothetical protein [Myoviridae sp. ctFYw8]